MTTDRTPSIRVQYQCRHCGHSRWAHKKSRQCPARPCGPRTGIEQVYSHGQKRLCTVPNCGKPYDSRGYCQGHHYRLLRYGDPLGKPVPRQPSPDSTHFKVLALRHTNPALRATTIAVALGVTRERVRQILVKANLPTHPPFKTSRICPSCQGGKAYQAVLCQGCRQQEIARRRPWVSCAWCQQPFQRIPSLLYQQKITGFRKRPQTLHFCNGRCRGRWLAHNYGFGSPHQTTKQALWQSEP